MPRLQPHHTRLLIGGAIAAAGAAALVTQRPSGPVIVRPGEDVGKVARGLKSGSTLLVDGNFSGQITLTGLRDITLQGVDQSTSGLSTISGGVCALKLVDFKNVTVDSLRFTKAGLYGLMAQNGDGLTLRRVMSTANGKTGILTASVDNVTVVDCTSTENREEHGLYLSERCRQARVSASTFSGNGKSGFQANFDKGRGSDIQVDHLTCDGNQKLGGAAAIQLAYVDGGSITDCVISNHRGRAGVAFFWTTKGVEVDRCRFGASAPMKACVSLDQTARNNTVGKSNQFAVGAKDVERQ